ESTAVAIMGRISCFTGELVALRDLLEREKSDWYNYTCTPAALDFEKGDVQVPKEVAAVPGEPDPRFS
ncbi:MAG: hypothetical protein R3242_03270, partial [Akkermansiaceae bacterium]|nr:hypothetical protein [Akkermansiaceae bacterium]